MIKVSHTRLHVSLVLLFLVSSMALGNPGKPAKAREKAKHRATDEILAELKPLVENFLGNLSDFQEYQNSDLKKKIDAYSEIVRRRELPGLLSRVGKQYRYNPTLTQRESSFKVLDKFLGSKKNSLPKNGVDIYYENQEVLEKENLSRSELRLVEAELRTYSPFLKELSDFMGNRRFVFSQTDFSDDNILTNNLSLYRQIVRILGLRIKLKLAKGLPRDALLDALLASKFASTLETSGGPLINYCVSIACKKIAASAIGDMLQKKQLSENSLVSLLALLRRYQSTGASLKKSLITEYRFIINGIAGWDTGNPGILRIQLRPVTFFLDEEATKSMHDLRGKSISRMDVMRHFEAYLAVIFADIDASSPWLEQRRASHNEVVKKQISIDAQAGKLSLLLTHNALSIVGHSVDLCHSIRNHNQALILATAIQLYEKKKSTLPKDLNRLVSESILSSIPIDLSTGKAYEVDWKKREVRFLRKPQSQNKVIVGF